MPGIPQGLLVPLRQALMDCDEFSSVADLRAVFAAEELRPWRAGLRTTDSLRSQVDLTIDYLLDKRRKDGTNALVLLLQSLAARYDPEDDRQTRLTHLAEQLDWLARRPKQPPGIAQEANPAATPMLMIAEAEKMLTCARAVARLDVPRVLGGKPDGGTTGTGWLIAPTLAVTCWHVIEARGALESPIESSDLQAQLANSLLTFDYLSAGRGLQYGITALEYPTIGAHPLDYAIVRLMDRADAPLRDRGYLRLDAEAPLTAQTSLYVIQHPLGQAQQVSGDTFERHAPTAGRILYKAPTEPGTSGAPVLNRANWRVVALHNGENAAADLREGTLLKSILVDLEQHRPELYREIKMAQSAAE